MKGLARLLPRVPLSLMCAGVVFALATANASGADRIPHPPGAVDHRGYELVSQADKNRNQSDRGSLLSTDGSRVLYSIVGALPGGTTGSRPIVLATRTASGWMSQSLVPSRAQQLGESYFETITTPDLDTVVASAFEGLGQETASPDESLVRLDAAGQTLLHTFPVYFGASGVEAVGSDDLSHVLANAPEPLDPSHVSGTSNVYDFGSGAPVLVSRMPGSGAAPACGVPRSAGAPGGFADSFASVTQHWVSTDGSRAFFETPGDTCSDPLQLFRRELNAAATTLISAPVVGGDADHGVDAFLQATGDGSQVFYRTATSLDPADDTDADSNDMDIYRWTAAEGNVCLTCVVPNASVSTPFFFSNAVVSEDGSHVYFTSQGQFAGAPAPGNILFQNLYVWHGGTIDFVAPSTGVGSRPVDGTELTPDGNTLVFPSFNPDLDAVTGRTNGSFFQYYRYDDRTAQVICLSCPASGPPSSDVPLFLAGGTQAVQADVGTTTDDGSMTFFRSSDGLVASDVNGAPDIYEWHNGAVSLITNGTERYTEDSAPSIDTVSRDGRDLLFVDTALLTTDAQDHARKLYDARIDGGFPPAQAPLPPCQGDQCRGASPGAPPLPDPASGSLTGAHNVRATRLSFSVRRVTPPQRLRLARTGRLTLVVHVRKPGKVSIVGRASVGQRLRTVAHASRSARQAGDVALRLRLSRAARVQLAREGRLALTFVIRFSKSSTARRLTLSLIAIPSHDR